MAAAAIPQPPPAPASTANWAPSVKVSYGPIAGAVSVLVMFLLDRLGVLKANSVDAATVGPAITTIITFAIQYFVTEPK
jgi:hypothetical protein